MLPDPRNRTDGETGSPTDRWDPRIHATGYADLVVGDLSFRARGGLQRVPGGIAAWSFPLLMTVIALGVDFRAAGGEEGIASGVLAAVLFLMAAPTAWLFTIDFIEAGRLTVVLSSLITSLPLWFLLGSRLAATAPSWGHFVGRYLRVCVLTAVATVLVVYVVGSLLA